MQAQNSLLRYTFFTIGVVLAIIGIGSLIGLARPLPSYGFASMFDPTSIRLSQIISGVFFSFTGVALIKNSRDMRMTTTNPAIKAKARKRSGAPGPWIIWATRVGLVLAIVFAVLAVTAPQVLYDTAAVLIPFLMLFF
jgi:hypothetical protein